VTVLASHPLLTGGSQACSSWGTRTGARPGWGIDIKTKEEAMTWKVRTFGILTAAAVFAALALAGGADWLN
jgi:hypothetical protein